MKINLFFLGMSAAFLLGSCQQQEEKKEFIRPVKLAEVVSLNTIEKIYPAVVSSGEMSNLAFKMEGPLIKMDIDEGEEVKKGTVVAVMDPHDYLLDMEAKRASFINAKSQMERSQKLLQKDAVSIQEFEMYKAEYVNAKSAYEVAKSTLEDTKLRAPFNGFIQKKFVDNYQRVQPGEKIVCLMNPNKIQVDFTIPENNIVYFNEDNSVYVEFDTYKGRYFKAKVKEYVKASPDGSGVPVYLDIDDPAFNLKDYQISVGFSCRVIIRVKNEAKAQGVSVPLSSIVVDNNSGSKAVFLFNESESTVKLVPVTSEGFIFDRDKVLVEGNLQPGQKVVKAGATMLIDGQKVKTLTE